MKSALYSGVLDKLYLYVYKQPSCAYLVGRKGEGKEGEGKGGESEEGEGMGSFNLGPHFKMCCYGPVMHGIPMNVIL